MSHWVLFAHAGVVLKVLFWVRFSFVSDGRHFFLRTHDVEPALADVPLRAAQCADELGDQRHGGQMLIRHIFN